MDKSEAKIEIQRLVDKFDRLSASEKKLYNEANTRKNFIMPLFRSLGWDVFDDFNKDEVVEEETTISGRLDYAFKLNSNTKFILEAKSISEDLDKEQWAIQAVEYGWNKGIPWVVLSDFEGLKVFNSEWDVPNPRPNLDFKYGEYVERFDDLWLLSKESFQNDLLDKQAQKWGITAKRESVNKYLSDDLIKWREILTKYFYQFNKETETIEVIEESVQKILDRLIFIRVVEDKGLEEKRLWQIFQEWEKNENIPQNFIEKLVPLFRRFNQDYDSNLFTEHVCERLVTTQEPFREIIPNLYENKKVKVKYRFDAITSTTDIFGEVYEQYLGYIQGREGDKSKRKKHGIYYTPSYIVDYIVREALKPVLDDCKSLNDLKRIKVLDLACGSGSFLIKSLEIIYEKYKDFNAANGSLTKLVILKDNLYGVDLDPQAVEIAKLNLLISSCDEKVKLPNLDSNIKNGNSLISGTDKELLEHFGKNFRDKKPFNWEEKFSEVFKQGGFDVVIGNPPYVKELDNKELFQEIRNGTLGKYYQGKMDFWYFFLHRAIDLVKDGGIVGFITNSYFLASSGASKLINRLKQEAILTKAVDFQDIPIFQDVSGRHIIHFWEKTKNVVNSTTTYLKIDKENFNRTIKGETIQIPYTKIFNDSVINLESDKSVNLINTVPLGDLCDVSVGVQESTDKITKKLIEKTKDTTFKVGKGVFVLSKQEIDDLKLSEEESLIIKKYLNISDVEKYKTAFNNEYLIYSDEKIRTKIAEGKFPHIKSHLDSVKKFITSSNAPYGLHRPRKRIFFESAKLICKGMFSSPEFTFDEQKYYVGFSFSVIIQRDKNYDLKYILGLLNSKFSSNWFNSNGKKRGIGVDIGVAGFRKFPVAIASDTQQKQIIYLVGEVLALNEKLGVIPWNSEKANSLKFEIERTDEKINEEVYKLYGLTQKEVEIVEKS